MICQHVCGFSRCQGGWRIMPGKFANPNPNPNPGWTEISLASCHNLGCACFFARFASSTLCLLLRLLMNSVLYVAAPDVIVETGVSMTFRLQNGAIGSGLPLLVFFLGRNLCAACVPLCCRPVFSRGSEVLCLPVFFACPCCHFLLCVQRCGISRAPSKRTA